MTTPNDNLDPLFHASSLNEKSGEVTHQFTTLPPLSLYIHLPWCERKCPYCDFNSHPSPGSGLPEKHYIEALIADLDSHLPQVWGRTLSTVFIGGGTPSLFSEAGIDKLLSEIRQRLPFNDLTEVTMEANPGTLEQDKLPGFRAAGVTRLSIGVQSFNDGALQRLGRIHDANQARRAIEKTLSAGFRSFNLDLMFGLPDQTATQAREDIDTALGFAPPHLSLYQLTLEPNTAFAKQPPSLPDQDQVAAMQTDLHDRIATAGLNHYEVSAFSTPGNICQHNTNYWQFGDYIGIGAGAHSKISFADKIIRERKIKDPARYLTASRDGDSRAESHVSTPAETVFEFMLNTMRLQNGVPLSLFTAHAGLPLGQLLPGINAARDQRLLAMDHQQLKPTPLGHRFLDDLTELFLP